MTESTLSTAEIESCHERLIADRPAARVALVHDWLTGMRGGEYVLEAIAEMFPDAEVFTLLDIPEKLSPRLAALKRHTSWLQKVPRAGKKYRHFLPLMPSMIESFDLSPFDLVISSSHCVAKGARRSPHAVHVSYVHAPMRYMWNRYDDYFGPGRSSMPVRLAARLMRKRLQNWDRRVSSKDRVDLLIGNSHYIAAQIKQAYQRDAKVIYPFADLARFHRPRQTGPNYLMVTAFAPYKRVDIAIEAFNRLKLPLLIVGSGQDEQRLRKLAGPTIRFLGSLSNDEIARLYSECKAFVFPGVEDFGITVVEALAAGAPVIALKEGGAAEIVTEKTGVFFHPQSIDTLMSAVEKLETGQICIEETACRTRAGEFSKEKFQENLKAAVSEAWQTSGKDLDSINFAT